MATRPLRTRRGPSTRRAFLAAQSMWTMASRISSWASAERLAGLGVHELGQPADVPGQVRLPGQQPLPAALPAEVGPPLRGRLGPLDGRRHVRLAEDRVGTDDLDRRRIQRVEGLRRPDEAVAPERGCHEPCTAVLHYLLRFYADVCRPSGISKSLTGRGRSRQVRSASSDLPADKPRIGLPGPVHRSAVPRFGAS